MTLVDRLLNGVVIGYIHVDIVSEASMSKTGLLRHHGYLLQ